MNFNGLRPYARLAETICRIMIFRAEAYAAGIPPQAVDNEIVGKLLIQLPSTLRLWCAEEAARRFRAGHGYIARR